MLRLLASLQTQKTKNLIAASSSRVTNRNLLPSLSVSQELNLRSVARKDAVEVMKAAEELKKRGGSRASSRGGLRSGGGFGANVSGSLTLSSSEYFHPSLYHETPSTLFVDNYAENPRHGLSRSHSREFFGKQRLLSEELRPEAIKIDNKAKSKNNNQINSFYSNDMSNDDGDAGAFNIRASTTWNISADSFSHDDPHADLYRGFSMPHLRD